MEFLFINRTKDVFLMLPLEQQAQIMDGSNAFIEKYAKKGTCKEIWAIPSIKGAASIWDVKSAEEGASLFRENPATPFFDFEWYALSDFSTQMKGQSQIYKKLLAKK